MKNKIIRFISIISMIAVLLVVIIVGVVYITPPTAKELFDNSIQSIVELKAVSEFYLPFLKKY